MLAQPASIFRFATDLLLGLFGARGSIARDGAAFLEKLLEVNSSRVQNDMNSRLLESRGRLEADIRILLRQVAHIAQQVLVHARAAQLSGAYAVSQALARLAAMQAELTTISDLRSKVER